MAKESKVNSNGIRQKRDNILGVRKYIEGIRVLGNGKKSNLISAYI